MKSSLLAWLATLMAAGAQQARPADATVYMSAGTNSDVWVAEMLAASMFRTIGVQVAWRIGKPVRDGSVAIRVELLENTPSDLKPGALAYAYPFSGTHVVTVFHDRVGTIAASVRHRQVLLAHVLVHEITHVLEQCDCHSTSGVMRAHWTNADTAAMLLHPLPFAPADRNLIRNSLAKPHRSAVEIDTESSHPERE